MYSTQLFKIAYELNYLDAGWITPTEILRAFDFTNISKHFDLLEKYLPENPSYTHAFSLNWIRWYVTTTEIGFEGTEEAFKEQHQKINQLIDQYAPKYILIDRVTSAGTSKENFLLELDSAPTKIFQRQGIPGLRSYYSSQSTLRKFL